MTVKYVVTQAHLSVKADEVMRDLKELQKTARSFDDVEEWVAQNITLFGGVPLQCNDAVSITFGPHLNDLARLDCDYLVATILVTVTRNAVAVDDLPDAFKIYNNEPEYKTQHTVVTNMLLKDWPLITAHLITDYRVRFNFEERQGADVVRKFMNPWLKMHFPKLPFETLEGLSELGLLPEGYKDFQKYIFDSWASPPSNALPQNMEL